MATEFLPGFFIGDAENAKDLNFLKRNNIRKIVNCASNDVPSFYEMYPDFLYYKIPVGDSSSKLNNDIMESHLSRVLQFVFKIGGPISRQNAVFIGCVAGISRSSSVCVAVLRTCCFDNIPDAVNYLLFKRPKAFFYGKHFNFKHALYHYFGK